MKEGRSAFKILTGKPTGKRPLGRPRRRWEDNIIMDLNEIVINTKNWVDSAQDRDYGKALVNAASKVQIPVQVRIFLSKSNCNSQGKSYNKRWSAHICA